MKLLDANLLLYAYNVEFSYHKRVKAWFEDTLNDVELVRFSWPTLSAFLRISTNYRAFPQPFSAQEACDIVSELLTQSNVGILEPGENHWKIFSKMIVEFQIKGPLVTDAQLAALAFEHGALLCSHDRDFKRFSGIKFFDPLSE